ncbi:MAG: amidohydrolase [Deltaproteobacteria bacterium]|nr:amidohydrolase [Deltaproteobacteria bacterium]
MEVLQGVTVLTMTERQATAEAVAFDENGILAVGRSDHVLAQAGPSARVRTLEGHAVVPGFVDAHHHFSTAVLFQGTVNCRPGAVFSIGDIQRRFRRAAEDIPPGSWVVGYGYDQSRLAEKRYPTRQDLDAACGDRPAVLVHYSFHELVASTRALELARIGRSTPDPVGGRIERSAFGLGLPTGRLVETAQGPVERLAWEALLASLGDNLLDSIARYERSLFACGITLVNDPTVSPDIELLFQRARAAGKLHMPVVMMPVGDTGYLCPPWDRLEGRPTGEGSHDLSIGPLKVFFDGGETCAVCLSPQQAIGTLGRAVAMSWTQRTLTPLGNLRRTPFRMGADLRLHAGARYHADDNAASALVERAVERGFAVAIHAIGNSAVAQAAEALGRVRGYHRDIPPPRIEHAILLEKDQPLRLAQAGLSVVTQPWFLSLFSPSLVPPLHGLRVLPLRTLMDRGVHVAGSSDAPVGQVAPLEAIRMAVSREISGGVFVEPDEAIDAYRALAMYTREGARVSGCLHRVGTIEPKKRADLVILSHDPRAPKTLGDVRVVETVLNGRTVYPD